MKDTEKELQQHTEHSHDHTACGCGHHHDHDHDFEVDEGLTVEFIVDMKASIERVWQMITENDQLALWFPELAFESLKPGGVLRFNYTDGGHEEMMVLDVEEPHYLSYTWDLNTVTFELTSNEENTETELKFTEWLSEINDHTPKDVAGWLICLQVIASIINEVPFEDRETKFHEVYPQVKEMLAQQSDYEFE